jgi:hypothetical protein
MESVTERLTSAAERLKAFMDNARPDFVTDDRVIHWIGEMESALDALDNTPADDLGPDHSRPGNLRLRIKAIVRTVMDDAHWLRPPTRERLHAFATEPPTCLCQSGYVFTFDCFSSRAHQWTRDLDPLMSKPGLRFLEIGSFEGHSACWLLDNVLTDCTSALTCVDFFEGTAQDMFQQNIKRTGMTDKVTAIKGNSHIILPKLNRNQYDFIYVDASHDQVDVLEDAVLAWPLLKVNGLMTFDDYLIRDSPISRVLFGLRPDIGIDAFLTAYKGRYTIVHAGYQLTVRKTRPTEPRP